MFQAFLFLVAYEDYITRRIPDRYVAGILALCGIFALLFPAMPVEERLMGSLAMGVLFVLLSLVWDSGFGGGDMKLMIISGFGLGISRIFAGFALAILAAGMYTSLLILQGKIKRKDTFPLGPFLCLGIWLAFFFGDSFIGWFCHSGF